MKTIAIFAAAVSALIATGAAAGTPVDPKVVPEIDALAGVAAIGLVAGALALLRERFKG